MKLILSSFKSSVIKYWYISICAFCLVFAIALSIPISQGLTIYAFIANTVKAIKWLSSCKGTVYEIMATRNLLQSLFALFVAITFIVVQIFILVFRKKDSRIYATYSIPFLLALSFSLYFAIYRYDKTSYDPFFPNYGFYLNIVIFLIVTIFSAIFIYNPKET